ncbi:sulfurtransferase [Rhodoblastus acidophilus]|uniref:Sulfurtransferase n=1 Tax=Rhodoblastus acidophilus TaxID=1074 RepID=A0A6N8DKI1_RHOAC|nr:sulfurtransferase [Rhodoblastus acidophilus]
MQGQKSGETAAHERGVTTRPIREETLKTALLGLTLALFLTPAFAGNYQPVDVSKLPEVKQSKLGLYLSAPEAFKMKSEGGAKVMFVDIRTKGEFQFVGTPQVTDQNIPYMEIDDPASWDKKNNRYQMSPNSDFVGAIDALAKRMTIGKTDPVILICRSGDRSSRAANLLQDAGYTKVYSVVDGVEGDMSPAGRRDVNGWKNADLPWSYKISEGQAYIR